MKKVLVTGGTGMLGRRVVKELLEKNYSVSVLSSRENPSLPQGSQLIRGDLISRLGLEKAMRDADIIIHCASDPKDSVKVDIEGTRNLLSAINRNKTNHVIYISIVGIDRSSYSYYVSKLEAEKMIRESGMPFSILRATQFHNYVLNIIRSLDDKVPPIKIPSGLKFQSIDIGEVAFRLVDLIKEGPGGLLPDAGGPQVLDFESMVQVYMDTFGRRDKIQAEQMMNERYQLFASGINLCPDNIYGRISWREFLS